MSNFDKHKVENLLVLVGNNSLPNYVAVKLLLAKDGTAYLIHTDGIDGTKKKAEDLRKVLDQEGLYQPTQLVSLGSNESDAYRIQQKVKDKVEKLGSSIGMNYTGGTKAMAVHAYRAMFHIKGKEAVYSYLDARNLEMRIDRQEGESERLPIRREDLSVSLETIFQLHIGKWKQEITRTPQMADLATVLAGVNADHEKAKAWSNWLRSTFTKGDGDKEKAAKKIKSNGQLGDWKSKSALAKLFFPLTSIPEEIKEGFKQKGVLDEKDHLSLQLVKELGEFDKLEHFCKWLDGIWLEHYLLDNVASVAKEVGISDYGMNFEVPLAGTKDGFEFDVAFTYGYQLFAISCTTSSNPGLCKSKLFEAVARSRQMGGDEARVALLCFADDLGKLKAEVSDLVSKKQIRIFGRKHLNELDTRIKQWVQENDAELNR